MDDIHPSDLLAEAIDNVRLVFMALSSMDQDSEIKILSAGVYDVERKLEIVAGAIGQSNVARPVAQHAVHLPKAGKFSP